MPAAKFYRQAMQVPILRLLVLATLMLMPLGMAAAPAAPLHQQTAMPMGHCSERDSTPHPTGALAACTMACASALPATDLQPVAGAHPVSKFTPTAPVVAALTGIELEIATPPPRQS
jgi:hypothetical protein